MTEMKSMMRFLQDNWSLVEQNIDSLTEHPGIYAGYSK